MLKILKLRFLRIFTVILLICVSHLSARVSPMLSGLGIGRLKYNGGGDWYNDPSCIPNLLSFLRKNTNIYTGLDEKKIAVMDEELFSLPVLYMTGHGRILFTDEEASRLRKYLTEGGFLYVDDDYGMDKFFRQQIRKVFPDKKLVELPSSHALFHCHFDFPDGIPKTHEHDPGPGQAFGIFHEGRMIVLYTFNTNISDGWADPDVHHDSAETREQALRMGVNIMVYALTH